MSKHQKKKNPPAVSSDDDETATRLLPTPGAVAPGMGAHDGCRCRTCGGRRDPAKFACRGRHFVHRCGKRCAGSSLPREVSPSTATLAAKESANRGRRLPHVRKFVAAGGDWSAFRWRFEAAYKFVLWSEEEALIALPTMLDGDALAMFHSIPADKKKTLQQAFQEMAEVYELPDDRMKKFQHRWWGSSELPLAYRSALMALAVDAYPNVTQELLDPLVMECMLALAWEMDVVLPTCGYEMKTSLWVARCLNAHKNLKRWAQTAA
ncbi:unnamed protein product [Lampetra fluviatilis]